MTTAALPRIVPLLAFVGLFWYVNVAAPRILPGILVLLVLYAALTNTDRVALLFGSAERSVATRFKPRQR